MFGLSTWEMLIIVAVALIFIGPDQLPKVAKQVGKGLRQVRGAVDKVDGEVRKAVREATAELEAEEEEADRKERKAAAEAARLEAEERARAEAARHPPQPELANTLPEPPPAQPHQARDWSQVGKAPIDGRVASARPGRPLEIVPNPDEPAATPSGDKKDKPAA